MCKSVTEVSLQSRNRYIALWEVDAAHALAWQMLANVARLVVELCGRLAFELGKA